MTAKHPAVKYLENGDAEGTKTKFTYDRAKFRWVGEYQGVQYTLACTDSRHGHSVVASAFAPDGTRLAVKCEYDMESAFWAASCKVGRLRARRATAAQRTALGLTTPGR